MANTWGNRVVCAGSGSLNSVTALATQDSLNLSQQSGRSRSSLHFFIAVPVSGKTLSWVPLCLCSVYMAKHWNDPATLKGRAMSFSVPLSLSSEKPVHSSHRHFHCSFHDICFISKKLKQVCVWQTPHCCRRIRGDFALKQLDGQSH